MRAYKHEEPQARSWNFRNGRSGTRQTLWASRKKEVKLQEGDRSFLFVILQTSHFKAKKLKDIAVAITRFYQRETQIALPNRLEIRKIFQLNLCK